ncbi:MAG: hypothetical protein KBH45_20475, partial [Verrucomicrobia bacterium]|nr:hypothetical protein [Verrucomicrobiota bacterium]
MNGRKLDYGAGWRFNLRTSLAIGVSLTALSMWVSAPAISAERLVSPNGSQLDGNEFRTVPAPLPDHPGNVFLEGEDVWVR